MNNLISFGRTLEEIREGLSLTKVKASELTGINTETIRRIEYGEVIPKFETLDRFSYIYKRDVTKLFIEHRVKDYSYFRELQNIIEKKINNDEISSLSEELYELETILQNIDDSSFYKMSIQQLILLINSVVLYKHEKEYDEALTSLTKAIKLTTPDFSLENYKSFVYNSIEIRLLMNIAFVLHRLENTEKYLEILQFCVDTVSSNDSMYPKLCHNLAGAYRRSEDFKLSLNYSNLAIKSAQEQSNYDGLYILYYGKGYSEYYLGMDNYKNTFKICLYLCQAFGKLELKETYISRIKNVLGIEVGM